LEKAFLELLQEDEATRIELLAQRSLELSRLREAGLTSARKGDLAHVASEADLQAEEEKIRIELLRLEALQRKAKEDYELKQKKEQEREDAQRKTDDVEQNVQDILKIARKLVTAKEFDKAAEMYSIVLTNYQSRMQNIPQGKLKKSRFDCDKTLKQWIATILHNLAVVYNLQGKHQSAVLKALDALKYRNEICESEKQQKDDAVSTSSTLHVIGSLLELALAHYGTGSFLKSREALSEALGITYRIFPYESTPMAAKIWNLLGCLQFEEGKLVAALDSFQESLEIQRSLLSNRETLEGIDRIKEYPMPDFDVALQHVSTTLCNIRSSALEVSRPRKCIMLFLKKL
jgi:tetratricopeptide (TPR) repeat protein